MNRLSENLKTGTIGELLVQIRLLQYDVQAAPALKDTGNDLIAVRDEVFRSIQVKTSTINSFDLRDLPPRYHLVACVHLVGRGRCLDFNQCRIYLLTRGEINGRRSLSLKTLEGHEMTEPLVKQMFAPPGRSTRESPD